MGFFSHLFSKKEPYYHYCGFNGGWAGFCFPGGSGEPYQKVESNLFCYDMDTTAQANHKAENDTVDFAIFRHLRLLGIEPLPELKQVGFDVYHEIYGTPYHPTPYHDIPFYT